MPAGTMPGPPESEVTSPARRNRTRPVSRLSPATPLTGARFDGWDVTERETNVKPSSPFRGLLVNETPGQSGNWRVHCETPILAGEGFASVVHQLAPANPGARWREREH